VPHGLHRSGYPGHPPVDLWPALGYFCPPSWYCLLCMFGKKLFPFSIYYNILQLIIITKYLQFVGSLSFPCCHPPIVLAIPPISTPRVVAREAGGRWCRSGLWCVACCLSPVVQLSRPVVPSSRCLSLFVHCSYVVLRSLSFVVLHLLFFVRSCSSSIVVLRSSFLVVCCWLSFILGSCGSYHTASVGIIRIR
jgi:hypothetical protein